MCVCQYFRQIDGEFLAVVRPFVARASFFEIYKIFCSFLNEERSFYRKETLQENCVHGKRVERRVQLWQRVKRRES